MTRPSLAATSRPAQASLATSDPLTLRPTTLSDWFADRLGLRLDEIARALGVSRRTLERERSAGRFPLPDKFIGKMPIWCPETIRDWIAQGGRS